LNLLIPPFFKDLPYLSVRSIYKPKSNKVEAGFIDGKTYQKKVEGVWEDSLLENEVLVVRWVLYNVGGVGNGLGIKTLQVDFSSEELAGRSLLSPVGYLIAAIITLAIGLVGMSIYVYKQKRAPMPLTFGDQSLISYEDPIDIKEIPRIRHPGL